MCVIIYKPAGKPMPTKNEFKAASICHPDGFGFIASNGAHYKGLSFKKFLHEIGKVDIDDECIIHFRYATHGSIKASNCHPFESNGVWFAHNGILSVKPIGDMTDSETAFQCILSPVADRYGVWSKQMDRAVDSVIGYSKFAMMKDGKVRLFGDFEVVDGIYYSNTRHRSFMTVSHKPLGQISWDEYINLRYSH